MPREKSPLSIAIAYSNEELESLYKQPYLDDSIGETQPLLTNHTHYTTDELDHLCHAYPDDNIKKYTLAAKLAYIYEHGNEDTTPDHWKAYHFNQKIIAHKKKNGLTVKPEDEPAPPSTFGFGLWRTDTVYRWHAWFFTGARLFAVRLNRIFFAFGRAFLPAFFAIFGLSYGVGFAIDLFMVLKTTFSPSEIKKELAEGNGFWAPLWRRFKNILLKDNRPYRMLNDAVWFIVNLIAFVLGGPLLNAVVNLIGFAFDTGHEFFWLGRDAQKYTRLINKVQNDPDLDDKTRNDLIEKLKYKRYEWVRRRLWISVCTTLILVGMIMVYFPPTAIPAAFLIGGIIAFGAGSILTGIGRRTYLYAEEYLPKFWDWIKTKWEPANKPEPDNKAGYTTQKINTELESHSNHSTPNSSTPNSPSPSNDNLVELDESGSDSDPNRTPSPPLQIDYWTNFRSSKDNQDDFVHTRTLSF